VELEQPAELAADPAKRRLVMEQVSGLDPRDLEPWGYPTDTLWEPLGRACSKEPVTRSLSRRALVHLRRRMQDPTLRRAVQGVRLACDVLLRG